MITWAYGVTTVPSRASTLFPRTLESLKKSGFDKPHLFVDGASYSQEMERYLTRFALPITIRSSPVRCFGNWLVALIELLIRFPNSDRFAIFQDDFVTYPGLRKYLDWCGYPDKGYLNLFTMPSNKEHVKRGEGWHASNQLGRGGVATVFNRAAVTILMQHKIVMDNLLDEANGWKRQDGTVVNALRREGWTEYVHQPSLVEHTGYPSSFNNKKQPQSISFRGEEYDVTALIDNVKRWGPQGNYSI